MDLKQYIRDIPDFPKPGIIFKDITPLLANPKAIKACKELLIDQWQNTELTAIMAIESRGFLFGMIMAEALNIKFIPVRKKGKLPYKTIREEYQLEYGTSTIEIHADALNQQDKVLIHDDLLATGGTAKAAANLAQKCNASVAGFSFLIELSALNGRYELETFSQKINSIIKY